MSEPDFQPIDRAVQTLPSITLAEMDGVKLLNRIDTKYLTDESTLVQVLSDAVAAGYRALETEGTKISPYNSIYYDTDALEMFLEHHNRRLVRQKVRTRVYVNSGDAFLEIKRKNNHGRTKKKRTGIPLSEMGDFSCDEQASAYLRKHSAYSAGQIFPVLSTGFRRITLVNPARTERLTIDSRLEFENFRTGRKAFLGPAVIIELKQDGHLSSPMRGILLKYRVKPVRISKYCLAETLTDPGIKSNRFKTKVRAIEKVTRQRIQVL
ncbi:MAG: polyphosphate polymerase domain-containing protein [Bacteroidales bacterium]|nr:polyphosphate polymerase domain-containing protein [Bacteroidales bacterium]